MPRINWSQGYNETIMSILGVTYPQAQEIQEIMRQEVFHSTLDWQDRATWKAGAKKAYKLYLAGSRYPLRPGYHVGGL